MSLSVLRHFLNGLVRDILRQSVVPTLRCDDMNDRVTSGGFEALSIAFWLAVNVPERVGLEMPFYTCQ